MKCLAWPLNGNHLHHRWTWGLAGSHFPPLWGKGDTHEFYSQRALWHHKKHEALAYPRRKCSKLKWPAILGRGRNKDSLHILVLKQYFSCTPAQEAVGAYLLGWCWAVREGGKFVGIKLCG